MYVYVFILFNNDFFQNRINQGDTIIQRIERKTVRGDGPRGQFGFQQIGDLVDVVEEAGFLAGVFGVLQLEEIDGGVHLRDGADQLLVSLCVGVPLVQRELELGVLDPL